MQPTKARNDLWMDLALVAFLIALCAIARVLPHPYGFLPVAASALFAGRMLHMPALALLVPVAAMLLSGLFIDGDDWRVSAIVYAALAVPALAGIWSRRFSGALPVIGTMVGCSLFFFAASNFAVWLFSGMYPLTAEGLAACYVAALPFLDKTVLGDLFWLGVLSGGAWLIQHNPLIARRSL